MTTPSRRTPGTAAPAGDAADERVRADVWLWAARFYRTRALARAAIEGGKVEVDGAGCKPSKALRAGQRLRIVRGDERMDVEILGLAEQRGSAAAAQALYRESEESRAARAVERERRRAQGAPVRPDTRPDKKARRALLAFKQQD